MPKKPTHPYGYISFSPQGKARKVTESLPDEKTGQEDVIAGAFAHHFGGTVGSRLPESDHDFEIVLPGNPPKRVAVQATEVVYWDFLEPMSQEEYDYPTPGRTVFSVSIDDPFANAKVSQATRAGTQLAKPNIGVPTHVDGRIEFKPTARPFAVNESKLQHALLNKIQNKVCHYAKPSEGRHLLLLVWTLCSGFDPFWIEGAKARTSHGIVLAQAYLARAGSGPFDEIWFMGYTGPGVQRPHRIWPPE